MFPYIGYVSNTAVDTHVQIRCGDTDFVSFGYILEMAMVDYMVVLFSIFGGSPNIFHSEFPAYIPSSSIQMLFFSAHPDQPVASCPFGRSRCNR